VLFAGANKKGGKAQTSFQALALRLSLLVVAGR
jgi:hypothetical protein